MLLVPPVPIVPDEHRARGSFVPQYDEVGQTGHLLLKALHIPLGRTAWPLIGRLVPERLFKNERIVPILSRLVLETGEAPFSVMGTMDAEAAIQFAHTVAPDGQMDRIMLNMWCSMHGNAGHTHGFAIPNAGARLFAGRVLAEHVLTRPFDPPETRRVTEFEVPGFPRVTETRYAWQAPEMLLQLPPGATWLDESLQFDTGPLVFGTDATDSNQHVNSLVYPNKFTESILRRLWDHGKRFPLRAKAAEIAYRKPSFSGERVHVALRAFVSGEQCGAVVILISDDDAKKPLETAKPRVFARMWFVRE